MKVLFFYQHFWPDSPPYASMLRVIGAGLAEAGHTPHVITAQPSYKISDRVQRSPTHEVIDGIDVHRLAPLLFAERLSVSRAISKILFPLRASITILVACMKGNRPDAIIAATIPPVINGLCALLVARLIGARFIYHVQDIYPELGVAGDLWKSGAIRHRVLLALDTFTCRHADRCVTLSTDMRGALMKRGLDGNRIIVLNNFMLSTPQMPSEHSFTYRRKEDHSEYHRIVFAGNLGRFQGLENLLEAFLSLDQDHHKLELHFLGEGVMADTLRDRASGHQRVHFHGHLPLAAAIQFIAGCDAGIVSIGKGIYQYAYPSKTLTYLGLGVPLLAFVELDSSLAKKIRTEQLGIVSGGREISDLVTAFNDMDKWLATPDADHERIRRSAERMTSSRIALDQWKNLIGSLEVESRSIRT